MMDSGLDVRCTIRVTTIQSHLTFLSAQIRKVPPITPRTLGDFHRQRPARNLSPRQGLLHRAATASHFSFPL